MKLVVSKASALVPGEYKVTLTAKTAAGNVVKKALTVLVPNLTGAFDAGVLSGLDTSDEGYVQSEVFPFLQAGIKKTFTLEDLGVSVLDGWTLAVTGLPAGWTYNPKTGVFSGVATPGKKFVTFTVSKKSGKKTKSYKSSATFNIAPLPTTIVGTFSGPSVNKTVTGADDKYGWRVAGEDGMVTVTVTAGGKVSASCLIAGTKYSFTGSGFTVLDDVYTAKLSGKVGKKKVTLTYETRPTDWMFKPKGEGEPLGEYGRAHLTGLLAANKRLETQDGLVQNVWAVPECGELLPTFASGLARKYTVRGNTLTLKFGAKGVVTYVYSTPNGQSSGSSVLANVIREEQEPDKEEVAWTAEDVVARPSKKGKVGTQTKKMPALYTKLTRFRFTAPTADEPVDTVDSALTESDIALRFNQGGSCFGCMGFRARPTELMYPVAD